MKSLNVFISFILIAVFITAQFSSSFIVLNYEINKAEITQKYCVNKEKPKMNCCGKCHVNKVLKKDQAKKEKTSFVKDKESIKLASKPLILNTIQQPEISNSFNSFIVNYTSNTQDISTPPPQTYC